MSKDIEQDLRSHDPDVLFLQLLTPSSSVPVIHIHVTTEVGHPEAGVLAQHICLLQNHNVLSQQAFDVRGQSRFTNASDTIKSMCAFAISTHCCRYINSLSYNMV